MDKPALCLSVGGAQETGVCPPLCLSSSCRGTQTKQQPLDHAADVDWELRAGEEKDKKEGIVGGSWREQSVLSWCQSAHSAGQSSPTEGNH